jgi:hypothetical protein
MKGPLHGFFLDDDAHIDNDELNVPAEKEDEDDDGPEAPRASTDPPPIPKGIKHSNEALRKSRLSKKNTVDFAGHIFGDELKMKRLGVLWEAVDPVVQRMKLGLTCCKKVEG